MPLDTSIPLQVQIPQFQDYSQLAAQTQQNALRNQLAQQEMQQNALRMQYTQEDRARAEAARRQSAAAAAQEKALRARILQESGGDAAKASSIALSLGRPDIAESYAKGRESMAKAGSEEADLEKKAFSNSFSKASVYAPLIANGAIPGRAVVGALFDDPAVGGILSKVMTREEALDYADKNPQGLAQILATPPDKIYDSFGVAASQAKPTVLPPGSMAVDLNPQSKTYGQPVARGEPVAPKGQFTEAQKARLKTDTAQDYNAASTALRDAQDLLGSVEKLSKADLSGVTGYQSMFPSFQEESLKAESQMKTLEGRMTALGKSLSASTGKLGNLAVQEYELLRNQIANFDPYKGEESTKQQLADIDATVKRIQYQVRDVYSRTYGDEDNPFPQFRELPEKVGEAPPKTPSNPLFNAADEIIKRGK